MKPGTFHARVAATTEMAAGIGLAGRSVHPVTAAGSRGADAGSRVDGAPRQRLLHRQEGWEYNLVLAVAAVAIAAIGGRQVQPGLRAVPGHGSRPVAVRAGGIP